MFPDGKLLHATIKDTPQCMLCNTIKQNNIIHIKCALGFCDEFPEYNIPDKELYPITHFNAYTHQLRCAKHSIFTNGPTLCKICEANDDIKSYLIKIST